MQLLSQKLVNLRKSKNLTQQQLAEKINYSDKVISKWERGESIPDIIALSSISKFYNISLDELMEHCSILKSDEKFTQLKKLGFLFHILLTCIPIIFLTFYICLFNFSVNSNIYIHNANSIILLVILAVLNIFTIINLILCHLKINHIWIAYVVFAIVCVIILFLIISCFIYGTATVLSSLGTGDAFWCVLASIITIAYGHIFYKKS